jgi:hypothetical protein
VNSSWLTTEALMAQLADAGINDVLESTLASWRRNKLLDRTTPEIDAYNGSATLHPPDTVARVIAIRNLQAEKDDLRWIGAQLWWRCGFPVHEDLWRPHLVATATQLDPVLRKLAVANRKEQESEGLGPTITDRIGKRFNGNIIASRMLGRVPIDKLGPVLKLIIDAASGIEPDYEVPEDGGRTPVDQSRAIAAFDFGRSGKDALAGRHFNFIEALLPVLRDIARALKCGTLATAATAPREEIEATRNDLRRAFELPVILYQSMHWIYGDGALGLRFADWVARKLPPPIVRPIILIWVLMRRTGAEILTSAEIAELHVLAANMGRALLTLKWLFENEPQFESLLNPKRVKAVFSGKSPIAPWAAELEAAVRLRIEGRAQNN